MAKQKKGSLRVAVTLNGLRPRKLDLLTPDKKFDAFGKFGIGVVLNAAAAAILNAAGAKVAADADLDTPIYAAGDLVFAAMAAGGVNKQTGVIWHDIPLVYLPNLALAAPDDVKKITNRSVLNINAEMKSFPASGKALEPGINLTLKAIQVVQFEGPPPTADDFGFAAVAQGDGGSASDDEDGGAF